jgi:hypothetical protein
VHANTSIKASAHINTREKNFKKKKKLQKYQHKFEKKFIGAHVKP